RRARDVPQPHRIDRAFDLRDVAADRGGVSNPERVGVLISVAAANRARGLLYAVDEDLEGALVAVRHHRNVHPLAGAEDAVGGAEVLGAGGIGDSSAYRAGTVHRQAVRLLLDVRIAPGEQLVPGVGEAVELEPAFEGEIARRGNLRAVGNLDVIHPAQRSEE